MAVLGIVAVVVAVASALLGGDAVDWGIQIPLVMGHLAVILRGVAAPEPKSPPVSEG